MTWWYSHIFIRLPAGAGPGRFTECLNRRLYLRGSFQDVSGPAIAEVLGLLRPR